MPTVLSKIREAIKKAFRGPDPDRIRRRRAVANFVYEWIPTVQVLLLVSGYCLLLALPSPRLGKNIFIDENALQPGQVKTYWDWGDVHRADRYLDQLEELRDRNATSSQRAEFLRTQFEKMGIPAATQSYSYSTSNEKVEGTNAYAIISVPRASGAEAMVISAPWISLSGSDSDTLNLRGVATVLALAYFLRSHSYWAKDLIFVIGDGHLHGMHAWLSTYHGQIASNLVTEPLTLVSGVIWTALNIDYPGHSFSHLGVYFEGLDGRLPNQDLYNSFHIISRHTGGVPVVLYDHLDPRTDGNLENWLGGPKFLSDIINSNSELQEYAIRAKNMLRLGSYQAFGEASGAHGLYHKYRIDAITLFAVPATGPHGFYSIGRVIESTLRTMNNLLERLHASFFFYVQTSPSTFLKIGTYLPSAILVGVSLLFGGLKEWVSAGWTQVEQLSEDDGSSESKGQIKTELVWTRRNRPVLRALLIMLITHMLGLLLFVSQAWNWKLSSVLNLSSDTVMGRAWNLFILRATAQAISSFVYNNKDTYNSDTNIPTVLKSMTLCFASSIITAISLLNFSLAAMLSVLLGVPLTLTTPKGNQTMKEIGCSFCLLYLMISMSFTVTNRPSIMQNWELYGVWYAPFMYIVYLPLFLQASLVCI